MSDFDTTVETIIVESVVPLTEIQEQELIKQLQLDPAQVIVKNRSNPLLIAGLRIHLRGKLIDLSFRHLLNQLTRS